MQNQNLLKQIETEDSLIQPSPKLRKKLKRNNEQNEIASQIASQSLNISLSELQPQNNSNQNLISQISDFLNIENNKKYKNTKFQSQNSKIKITKPKQELQPSQSSSNTQLHQQSSQSNNPNFKEKTISNNNIKSEYQSIKKEDGEGQNSISSSTQKPSVIYKMRKDLNKKAVINKVIQNQQLIERIRQVINQYKEQDKQFLLQQPTRSYRIIEDLQLIEAMSRKQEIKQQINQQQTYEMGGRVSTGFGPNFWINIVKQGYIQRALESIRDRSKRFIRNINEKDVQNILLWIEKNNSVNGFLNFVGSHKKIRGDKFFSHISKDDPITNKKKKFGGGHDLLFQGSDEDDDETLKKEEEVIVNGSNQISQPRTKIENSDDNQNFEIQMISDIDDIELKSIDESEFISGHEAESQYLSVQNLSNNNNQIKLEYDEIDNGNDNLQISQYNVMDQQEVVQILQNKYKFKNQQELLILLDSTNWNINDTISLIENPELKQKLAFTEEDDKNLERCLTQYHANFVKLKCEKGLQRILSRIQFKKLKLKFKIM